LSKEELIEVKYHYPSLIKESPIKILEKKKSSTTPVKNSKIKILESKDWVIKEAIIPLMKC